ncbi:MAG: transposase, partial [Candidatus Woesearchaeota archaeon]
RLKNLPTKLVADRGYDAEWLHRYCAQLGIQAVIPMRNYGAKKIYRGKSFRKKFRKKSQKHFTLRTYHRREIVEIVLSAIKRKFCASVSSVNLKAQKAEMYCRAIAHNISASLYDFLNGAQRDE